MNTLADHLSRAGISQTDLARALKVSQPTVSDWVRKRKAPRPFRVPAIAKALGITPSRLYADLYPPVKGSP